MPRTDASSTSAPAATSEHSASPLGDAVPTLPPSVPRLRICAEPVARDAATRAGSRSLSSCDDLGVRQARAEPHAPVAGLPAAELRDAREVQQRGRPAPVEVEVDHDVGPAAQRDGVGPRRARFQRRLDAHRPHEVHGQTLTRLRAAAPDRGSELGRGPLDPSAGAGVTSRPRGAPAIAPPA